MKEQKQIIKKTMYIQKNLIKELKLKAIIEESSESETLNKILSEYFKAKGN